MQERRHLLLRRAGFRCVLPAIPPRAAAASIASIPGRICASRSPKNSSRASIQTARQHTPTAMAAGSFCPAACRAVSQAPGKTPRKLIAAAAAESCCWPITPPSVSPAPSADSASSAAHVTASPCSTVRRKPPFQSFDFVTAPLLYSLFASLLQAYVCPGIKRTG